MTHRFYNKRCKCNENVKRNLNNRSEGKPLEYPDPTEMKFEIFQIKYEKKLSSLAKFILNTFQNKYLYYAIDDILYLLKTDSIERNNLLTILYSPVISIQNNRSVHFFDIWIDQIDINEVSKVNKFLTKDVDNFEQFKFNYITIKLLYKTRTPPKKPETLW